MMSRVRGACAYKMRKEVRRSVACVRACVSTEVLGAQFEAESGVQGLIDSYDASALAHVTCRYFSCKSDSVVDVVHNVIRSKSSCHVCTTVT